MSATRRSVGEEPPYVEAPLPNDVLFGRGSGPNDHVGNVYFRSLVRERKSEYMATNHRQTKANIANDIVTAIRAKHGRFLKKADARECRKLGLDEEMNVWCFVDEKTIMEKAKQALRQKVGGGDDEADCGGPRYENQVQADRVLSEGGIRNVPTAYQGSSKTPAAHFAIERPVVPAPPNERPMVPPNERPVVPPNERPIILAARPEIYRSGDLQPDIYRSGDLLQQQQTNQEQQLWGRATCSSGVNSETMQGRTIYTPSQSCQTVEGFLSEDVAPRQRYSQVATANPQRGNLVDPTKHQERLAEEDVHRSVAAAAADYQDEEVGDGPEDDDRRRSLQVEDLMRSFHRMGTDEMGTSSSENLRSHESIETMGTIEPLPMGASNVSMMSSSTLSLFKGALCDTPRGSLTRPAKSSRQTSSGSNSQGTSSDGKARRESGSSDMSLSFTHMDTAWGQNSGGSRHGNQISLVIEGNELDISNQELEGDASNQKISAEPRPVHLMQEDPDSLTRFGSTSMSILKATLGDSGDAMGTSSARISQNDSKGAAN